MNTIKKLTAIGIFSTGPKNKKFILIFACIIAGSITVFAQSNYTDSNCESNQQETAFVTAHLNKMKADIQLTAQQESAMENALRDFYNARKQSAQKSSRQEQLNGKKLDYELFVAVRDSIITVEQRAELQQKAEERREAGKDISNQNAQNSQQSEL
jgi:Spy/CpxP family protein refolding chaperone